jgi:hypothetical protein
MLEEEIVLLEFFATKPEEDRECRSGRPRLANYATGHD